MIVFVSVVLAGYVLGSIPTSLVAGRLSRGIDIREYGSGNAGAANVLRVLGWKPALAVLGVDVGKGWLAVWLALRLQPEPLGFDARWLPLAAGLAAVFGHLWPVWAGFRGGKGVATAAGVMLAIHPAALAAAAVVFALVVAITRRIAVGSITAALGFPLALYVVDPTPASPHDIGVAAALAVLIMWTHRSNIRNLLAGTEPRV